MQSIAIVGVGLIGGSFALALRAAGFTGDILGVSSEATLAEALLRGVIDEGTTLEQAAARADVIYLAQPVSAIIESLGRLNEVLVRDNVLVTDAGSTKGAIIAKARELRHGIFVGGHPIAGKETSGLPSADPLLFVGKPYVMIPLQRSDLDTPLAGDFLSWLGQMRASVTVLSAEDHDRLLAWTSHLPQLLSTCLAVCIGDNCRLEGSKVLPAGTGLRDMTRLAQSPYAVWGDILKTNRDELSHVLQVYIDKLTYFRQNLTTSDIAEDFSHAAEVAAWLRENL